MINLVMRCKLLLILACWIGLENHNVYSQSICQGSLGSNIFIEGDFGSGNSTILAFDPNIAPGYMYTQQMPPYDGYYTITNNSGAWPSIFPTWLHTRDASNDVNGYYMVVNASFSPGIFYEQNITGLCENTQYEFSADIINMIQNGVADHILPNVAFYLDGVEQFNTGDIPQTNQWINFGFIFTTIPGQTSIELTLRNNAPGGIGNDLGLDNIGFRACGPLAFINPAERTELCKNDPLIEMNAVIEEEQAIFDELQWQISTDLGLNWTDINLATNMNHVHDSNIVGTYLYRYLLATSLENLTNSKCRIQSDIAEIVVLPEEFITTDTICEGTTLNIGGQSISQTGDYVLNLISQAGCDSIVYLALETVPDLPNDAEIRAFDPECYGESTGVIELLDFYDYRVPFTVTMNGEEVPTFFTNFQSAIVTDLPAGLYEFIAEDKYGCQTEFDIILSDPPEFEVNAGADWDLHLGETVNINAFLNDDYSQLVWSPGIGLSCTDCPNPELLAISDQLYILHASNRMGCEARDSFLLTVDDQRAVFVPNAFSPNEDGVNDYFRFFSIGRSVMAIKSWHIFDRWGTLVFDGSQQNPNDPNVGWDGRFKAKKLDSGVYIYVLEIEYLDGLIERFRGNLTLVR